MAAMGTALESQDKLLMGAKQHRRAAGRSLSEMIEYGLHRIRTEHILQCKDRQPVLSVGNSITQIRSAENDE